MFEWVALCPGEDGWSPRAVAAILSGLTFIQAERDLPSVHQLVICVGGGALKRRIDLLDGN